VTVRTAYDAAAKRYTVTLAQGYGEASEASRATQQGPLLIPFAIGLIGGKGSDLPLELEGEKEPQGTTRVLELTEREQSFTFVNVAEKPLPSQFFGAGDRRIRLYERAVGLPARERQRPVQPLGSRPAARHARTARARRPRREGRNARA
jgi:aminopeptidase N